jgi:hypothetical protein
MYYASHKKMMASFLTEEDSTTNTGYYSFKDPGSALAAINRFDGFSMEGGKSLTVRYTKGNQRKGSYGNNNARQPMIGAPLQAWAHELPSAPIRNGGHDSRENRRFIRTTPPRNHAYSSSKPSDTLPPNPFQQARDSTAITQAAVLPVKSKYLESQMPHLPAKPQYPLPNSTWNGSPSNISSTQLNCIQGPMQTPEKTQHAAGSEQLSATGRKDSVERSGRSGGRRHYGSENSKTERKTPKKQKAILGDREILASGGSVNTTNSNLRETVSTNSPAKVLPTSAGNPTAESKNMNFVSSVTSPILNTQSKGNRSLSNSRSPTASDVVPQLHDFSGCSTEYPQMDSSTSNSDARSNSVSSTGPDCCSISGQPSRAYIGTLPHKKTLSSESVPATAREVINLALASVLEPPIDPKESDVKTELVHQQKKKKPKNKKRSPNQSNKSSVEITADSSVSPAPRNHPNHGTRDRSKAETRSHLKTDSNTTSSSATSTQSTSPKAETAASPIQRTINCKKSPGRKDLDGSTPPDVPRRQSPRTKKSMQSKSNDGDDVFQDTKSALVKRAQDAKRLSQEKIDISGSETPSTGKSNSSSKKATSQVFEENPTPTRKPQSRHRNNKSDQKTSVLNGKENKKPLPSPTEILSDPSNWPALGSTKLQLDTKSGNIQKSPSIAKPLGERALPPAPIRRDSMASVVSQPPQIFRRLT